MSRYAAELLAFCICRNNVFTSGRHNAKNKEKIKNYFRHPTKNPNEREIIIVACNIVSHLICGSTICSIDSFTLGEIFSRLIIINILINCDSSV